MMNESTEKQSEKEENQKNANNAKKAENNTPPADTVQTTNAAQS